MKKVLIILLILLSLGVIAFGIFYASTHDFRKKREEEKKENIELNDTVLEVAKENSIKLVETKKIDESFVQVYNIVINNKERVFEVEFLYRNQEDLKELSLLGDYNGATLYAYYEKYKDEATVDVNMITSSFNENNFSFISGGDGESYLLIHTNIYSDGTGEEDKLFILNENLEFVDNDLVDYAGSSDTHGMTIMSTYTGYILEGDEYPWYTDNFNACTTPSNCYIDIKIEDNKIYYLTPVLKEVSSLEEEKDDEAEEDEVTEYGELEERVYTIHDGNLEYEVIKRYKIVGITGQTA